MQTCSRDLTRPHTEAGRVLNAFLALLGLRLPTGTYQSVAVECLFTT
jgi:hypothetical protein